MDRKIPNIITIASIKGGVGKSTTAILFAKILSKKCKVLLIDMDPQNSVTSYFIPQEDEKNLTLSTNNIYTLLKKEKTFKDVMIKINKKLDFVPSYVSLSKFTKENNQAKELMLKNAIYNYLGDYDYIIIDTPPTLNTELDNAIFLANNIIIPVPVERWAVENLEILINQVKQLDITFNETLTKNIFLFISMFIKNRATQKDLASYLSENYKNEILGTVHKSEALNKMIAYSEEPVEIEKYYKEYMAIINTIISK